MSFIVVRVDKLVQIIRCGGVILVNVLYFMVGLFIDNEVQKVNYAVPRNNRRDDN